MRAFTREDLVAMRLPDLQAVYRDVVDSTRNPPVAKAVLINRILTQQEAEAANGAPDEAPVEEVEAPVEEVEAPVEVGAAEAKRRVDHALAQAGVKTLGRLDIDQLRALYVAVIGRPTGSSHPGYLVWKIREATKGRVAVGARIRPEGGASRVSGETKYITLPLTPAQVEALAGAMERLNVRSRADLARLALAHYLDSNDEHAAAILFDAHAAGDGAQAAS